MTFNPHTVKDWKTVRLLDRYWVPGECIANVVIARGATCSLDDKSSRKEDIEYEVDFACGCKGIISHGRLRRRAAAKGEHTGMCREHSAKAKAVAAGQTRTSEFLKKSATDLQKTKDFGAPYKAPYYEGDQIPKSRLYPVMPKVVRWEAKPWHRDN